MLEVCNKVSCGKKSPQEFKKTGKGQAKPAVPLIRVTAVLKSQHWQFSTCTILQMDECCRLGTGVIIGNQSLSDSSDCLKGIAICQWFGQCPRKKKPVVVPQNLKVKLCKITWREAWWISGAHSWVLWPKWEIRERQNPHFFQWFMFLFHIWLMSHTITYSWKWAHIRGSSACSAWTWPSP